MKTRHVTRWLAAALLTLAPLTAQAEEPGGPRFGVALNAGVSGEVYPMQLVPSALLLLGKSQLEAGVGFHPFIRKDQRIWSGDLNYKYYPNGIDNKLSLYVLGRLSYVHNKRETFYPTTYHYLFLNGGYGMAVNNPSGLYLGTDVSVGAFTYNRRSENPYDGFDEDGLFDERGLTLAFQFSVGYRF